MSRWTLLALAILVILIPLSEPALAQAVDNRFTIVPGISMGYVFLGHDINVIIKSWGKPANIKRGKFGLYTVQYDYEKYAGLIIGTKDDGVVSSIETKDQRYRTNAGYGPGSSYTEFVNVYGGGFFPVDTPWGRAADYPCIGMLAIFRQGTVWLVGVFPKKDFPSLCR